MSKQHTNACAYIYHRRPSRASRQHTRPLTQTRRSLELYYESDGGESYDDFIVVVLLFIVLTIVTRNANGEKWYNQV